MSNLSKFLKSNKVQKQNTTYAATKSLLDDNGKPLLWTIKPLSTKENDAIRDDCMYDVQIPGKPGQFKEKLNSSKYIAKLLTASIVEPDLHNKELQESYGVMGAEDLIKEMIDNPGEYADLATFIQNYNGFTETFDEEVKQAKN